MIFLILMISLISLILRELTKLLARVEHGQDNPRTVVAAPYPGNSFPEPDLAPKGE